MSEKLYDKPISEDDLIKFSDKINDMTALLKETMASFEYMASQFSALKLICSDQSKQILYLQDETDRLSYNSSRNHSDICDINKILKEHNRAIELISREMPCGNKLPYRCPVCDGCGRYGLTEESNGAICQGCEGKGIVWG